MPRTIRLLKDKYPDLVSEHSFMIWECDIFLVHVRRLIQYPCSTFVQVIYTDVALDPYSSDGHDGIVREDGTLRTFPFAVKIFFSNLYRTWFISLAYNS